MKRILYLRHGESTANINGIAGTTDAQLTSKGAAQAKKAGVRLQSENIVTIACSPYIRARQTAEIIATELGIPVYEIVTIDELHERFMGDLEGTSGIKPVEFFLSNDTEHNFEPRQLVIDRLLVAVDKLKNITQAKGGTSLAIAHGTVGYYISQISKGFTKFDEFDPPTEMNNVDFIEIWTEQDKSK
jgi:probable phosphoglycerate mutase